MNDSNKAELKNRYSEVALIIIDEVSMDSSKLFYQTRKRENEIFSPGEDIPFGGKSVLVCEDQCQLPPVRTKPVFTFNETETMEGFISMDLWLKFRLAGLDQVMHQDDEMFINMLGKIRVGEFDQNVEDVIKSPFIDKNDLRSPGNILHIFAENSPGKRHNDSQLKHILGQLMTVTVKDEFPKSSKISYIRGAQNRKQ